MFDTKLSSLFSWNRESAILGLNSLVHLSSRLRWAMLCFLVKSCASFLNTYIMAYFFKYQYKWYIL